MWVLLISRSNWGIQVGSKLMICIQGWPSKGLEGLGPNLSLLTYKIHILKPWVEISRCFPKANFILGHPVYKFLLWKTLYFRCSSKHILEFKYCWKLLPSNIQSFILIIYYHDGKLSLRIDDTYMYLVTSMFYAFSMRWRLKEGKRVFNFICQMFNW